MTHHASAVMLPALIILALGVVSGIPLLVITVRADRRAEKAGGPHISAKDNWNLFRASAFRFLDYLEANPDARTRLRLRQGLFTAVTLVGTGLLLVVIALLGWMAGE